MNRHLLAAIGLLALGVQHCSAAPVTDEVLSRVQKQVDQCVVPVTMTLKWNESNKASSHTYKATGVIISSQGALLVNGKFDHSAAWDLIDNPKKTSITGQPMIKLSDGRSIAYRLKAYHQNDDFCILVPDKAVKAMPYIDITQPYMIPLGQPVLSVEQSQELLDFAIKYKKVMSVPGKSTVADMFEPQRLMFSPLTGRFLGWFGDETVDDVSVWAHDARTWELISKNAGIQVTPAASLNEPVDPVYQRVYEANRNSMGTLRFETEVNHYEDTPYYALTAKGDILVSLPLDLRWQVVRPGAGPAKATLLDGIKCQMRWRKIDKAGRLAILSPVVPLKRPLKPIIWRMSSLPQIGDTVYACIPARVMSGIVHGYDPSYADRFALDFLESDVLFDSEGRAAALTMHSEGKDSFIYGYNGADTTVRYLRRLMPGIRLSVDSEARIEPSHPIIAKLPHDFRNWGYLNPFVAPYNSISCSVVCIDESGYFVTPYTGYYDDGKTTHPMPDSTPQQIRSYLRRDFDSAIVDEKGKIGSLTLVFFSEKLGLSIGKMRKPPLRPLKAIDLTTCQPPALGEELYTVDASLANGKMMQLFIRHTVLQPAVYPFTATVDRNNDVGTLCYSLDGQPRGYITLADPSKASSPLILVDLAEIAKKLAIVKEALGDR